MNTKRRLSSGIGFCRSCERHWAHHRSANLTLHPMKHLVSMMHLRIAKVYKCLYYKICISCSFLNTIVIIIICWKGRIGPLARFATAEHFDRQIPLGVSTCIWYHLVVIFRSRGFAAPWMSWRNITKQQERLRMPTSLSTIEQIREDVKNILEIRLDFKLVWRPVEIFYCNNGHRSLQDSFHPGVPCPTTRNHHESLLHQGALARLQRELTGRLERQVVLRGVPPRPQPGGTFLHVTTRKWRFGRGSKQILLCELEFLQIF